RRFFCEAPQGGVQHSSRHRTLFQVRQAASTRTDRNVKKEGEKRSFHRLNSHIIFLRFVYYHCLRSVAILHETEVFGVRGSDSRRESGGGPRIFVFPVLLYFAMKAPVGSALGFRSPDTTSLR